MPKIAIIGAGSAVFAKQLMIDFLSIPALEKGEFALVDIDGVRLGLAHQLTEKIISLSPFSVRSHYSTRILQTGKAFD